MAAPTFPANFFWGTATASFQIEGATRADGRGKSIWDRFAATPGKIRTGETGDPACDSYYRYQDDIAIMRELGLNAYRFSIAWPRVVPDGDGAINAAGLDYYDRVVDALCAAGVEPFVTLYHWDLPQALQDRGGWAERATVDAFLRYVDEVVARLGDRVKYWATHNEPWCIAFLSNELGEHAPGLRHRPTALQVAHNVLLSHGMAVPIIRQRCPDGQVGIVVNFTPAYPATDSTADQRATQLTNARVNRWFIDPISGRGYPQDAWDYYGADVPQIAPGDMEAIAAPLDFLGVNYYEDRNNSIVYTLPIHGGMPKRITSHGPSYLHGWSPDGKFLAYTGARNGAFNIYIISADGGEETQLTHTQGLDDGPEYAPDGSYIYFNSSRSGTMQIWRMWPDGSAQEQLTSDEYNNWFPHLSPDGQLIVFLSYSKEVDPKAHPPYKHVYLRSMPADGGAPKVVAYVYGGQGTINVPSWSPDSKRIAFVSNTAMD